MQYTVNILIIVISFIVAYIVAKKTIRNALKPTPYIPDPEVKSDVVDAEKRRIEAL